MSKEVLGVALVHGRIFLRHGSSERSQLDPIEDKMLKYSSVKLGEKMADTCTAWGNNYGATETSRLSSLCDL